MLDGATVSPEIRFIAPIPEASMIRMSAPSFVTS